MAWTHTRALIARTIKADPTADVSALRAQLALERRVARIQEVVNEAPPLTDDQKAQIRALLHAEDLQQTA